MYYDNTWTLETGQAYKCDGQVMLAPAIDLFAPRESPGQRMLLMEKDLLFSVISVQYKRGIAWYKVFVPVLGLYGWINSISLLCKRVENAQAEEEAPSNGESRQCK